MTLPRYIQVTVLVLILIAGGSFAVWKVLGQTLTHSASPAVMTVRIEGPLCCNYCAASLDVALAKVRGVLKTSTDYEMGVSVITYESRRVERRTILNTIQKRGYKVLSVVDGYALNPTKF